jgi:hypothetical protein
VLQQLVRTADLSQAMAEFREDIGNPPLQPTHLDNEEEIKRWIERTFSLKYKSSQSAAG